MPVAYCSAFVGGPLGPNSWLKPLLRFNRQSRDLHNANRTPRRTGFRQGHPGKETDGGQEYSAGIHRRHAARGDRHRYALRPQSEVDHGGGQARSGRHRARHHQRAPRAAGRRERLHSRRLSPQHPAGTRSRRAARPDGHAARRCRPDGRRFRHPDEAAHGPPDLFADRQAAERVFLAPGRTRRVH